MAGIANNPNSPRQKMINLMYLVFIAMMALNVSSEVLDGFELVEGSLRTSIDNTSTRNEIVTGRKIKVDGFIVATLIGLMNCTKQVSLNNIM